MLTRPVAKTRTIASHKLQSTQVRKIHTTSFGRKPETQTFRSSRLFLSALATVPSVKPVATTQRTSRRASPALPALFQGFARAYATQKTEVFHLADIGEGIDQVEILQWYAKEGDLIEEFDPLCEVQSDKATVPIKSPFAGKIIKLYYKVGEFAKVHTPLMDIAVDASAAAPTQHAAPSKQAPAPVAATPASASSHTSLEQEITYGDGKIKVLATPAVRHLARVQNIDLAKVAATGRDGRVLKSDLLNFISAPAAAATPVKPTPAAPASQAPATAKPYTFTAEDRVEVLRGYRKAMVKSMQEALKVPHFGYSDEITMDNLMKARSDFKELTKASGLKISYMPFIIKACSLALKRYPLLNSSLSADQGSIIYKSSHNIGVAVDTPNGLVVPNIKNVQNLSLRDVATELQRIVSLADANKYTSSDLTGGTFTLSNVGTIGGTYASPVVVVPEVCIGALGKISKLPRFDKNDQVYPAHIMQVSWSCDHRVVDGATIANFTNLLKQYLENPSTMLLDTK